MDSPLVVAVDPAARGFAWAVFVLGSCVGAGLGKVPADVPVPPGRAVWCMESPRDYVGFGVAHKDLDRLRATLADLDAYARARGDAVEYISPGSWKGNVPKPIHHRRVLAVRTPKDVVLAGPGAAGYDHNVVDAFALGMYRVKRTGRGGTRS